MNFVRRTLRCGPGQPLLTGSTFLLSACLLNVVSTCQRLVYSCCEQRWHRLDRVALAVLRPSPLPPKLVNDPTTFQPLKKQPLLFPFSLKEECWRERQGSLSYDFERLLVLLRDDKLPSSSVLILELVRQSGLEHLGEVWPFGRRVTAVSEHQEKQGSASAKGESAWGECKERGGGTHQRMTDVPFAAAASMKCCQTKKKVHDQLSISVRGLESSHVDLRGPS